MTDAQAQKFVAALDKIDVALMAIRMEFEEQVRISNERLAKLRAGKEPPRRRLHQDNRTRSRPDPATDKLSFAHQRTA